uniref:BED-type domain-containing protein n=1 Tax=Steinernema glaseri TaxID=37863 RepID=A0A1I7ZJS8_9BILA
MSIYDEFFDFNESRTSATCKKCGNVYATKWSNRTGLKKHLQGAHPGLLSTLEQKKEEPATKRSKIDKATPSVSAVFGAWKPGGVKTEAVNRALACMIAVDSQPVAMVDRPGFRHFMSVVAPCYKIRSRTTICRNDIPALYEEYKERIRNRMSSAKYISFTTDSWSSETNDHSLLSLTAHWIDNGSRLHRILGVMPIKGRHTSENLAQLLIGSMADFLGSDATERCHLVVRDAASVMKKTTRLCGLPSIDCFAHKLQLAVYGGLKKLIGNQAVFDDLVERIKRFIRKIRKSGIDKEAFKALQEFDGLEHRWLIKGIDIRWGSLFDMIHRFNANRNTVTAFTMDRTDYPKFELADFVMMEKIIEALRPVKEATVMLQHRDASIAVIIPTIFALRTELKKTNTSIADAILSDFNSRIMECNIESDKNFVIATLLDPRFKLKFIEKENRDHCVEMLKREGNNLIIERNRASIIQSSENRTPEVRSIEKDSTSWFFERYEPSDADFEESSSVPPVAEELKLVMEIEHYMREPSTAEAGPLAFWSNPINTARFPLLLELATKFLSSPATSVESERLFSTASMVLTDLRRSLDSRPESRPESRPGPVPDFFKIVPSPGSRSREAESRVSHSPGTNHYTTWADAAFPWIRLAASPAKVVDSRVSSKDVHGDAEEQHRQLERGTFQCWP